MWAIDLLIYFLPKNYLSLVGSIFDKAEMLQWSQGMHILEDDNFFKLKKRTPPRTLYRKCLESFITQSTVFLLQTCDAVIGNFHHKYYFYLKISVEKIQMYCNIMLQDGKSVKQMFLKMIFLNKQAKSFSNTRKNVPFFSKAHSNHSKHIPPTILNILNLSLNYLEPSFHLYSIFHVLLEVR